MCVILLGKNKDIQKLDLDLAWRSNPHGAGIVYQRRGGEVVAIKGLMSLEDLRAALREVHYGVRVGVHLRYATHGAVNAENTHPWPVGRRGAYLMHNGVLGQFGESGDRGRSDSAHLAELLGQIRDREDRMRVLGSVSGMYLYADCAGLSMTGSRDWIRSGGVLMSNDYWIPVVSRSWINRGYNWGD